MPTRTPFESGLGWLYDQATGDEDARVCKDIPDEACEEQPRNFFAYLAANLFNKIADELVSARLTLPWLFNSLGIPATFIGFLVPIREAGVLLPQLLVAAYVRAMAYRKRVWLLGAGLSTLTLLLMAVVARQLSGPSAGWGLLMLLVLYSLARGLCSVSAKDVLGKTISRTRRGRLMGYTASLAGLGTLAIGMLLQMDLVNRASQEVLLVFLISAAVLWLLALLSFGSIIEPAGATAGGGNAFDVARESLQLVIQDKPFREYLISRLLLMSVALVIPFYVLLIQNTTANAVTTLGLLIIASGLANSLSAPIVGKLADQSSRLVMAGAALLAGLLGIVTWFTDRLVSDPYVFFITFFLVSLSHSSVRLGRKVYLVDMASQANRAQYVALSNTIIGIAMLLAGTVGVVAELLNVESVILILSLVALGSSGYIIRLREVSG
ncbi:MAG: MFS transporter [Granulosicoccaceae bacterium]